MEIIKEFYGAISMRVNNIDCSKKEGKMELKYYKIISKFNDKKNRRFGIEVIKKCTFDNIVSEEKKEVFNCIEKEDVAEQVLEVLKVNKVSPINVVDILEDMSARKHSLIIK